MSEDKSTSTNSTAEQAAGANAQAAAASGQEAAESQELISFGIIANAGQARSFAFEALRHAREGDYAGAHELLDQASKMSLEAHHQQTALLSREAAGEHTPVDVMLVHAQDHLMCAMLAQELITELVYLHEHKQDREGVSAAE